MTNINVVSIGYERRTQSELVNLLVKYRVGKVLDVRQMPLSRRAGFSKLTLSKALSRAGIEYQHLRVAGNPYRSNKIDIEHCLRLYSRHLVNNPRAIELVGAELSIGPVALLCYERLHNHCHRSVLLEALIQGGYRLKVFRVE